MIITFFGAKLNDDTKVMNDAKMPVLRDERCQDASADEVLMMITIFWGEA